jgi:hypothetical protein
MWYISKDVVSRNHWDNFAEPQSFSEHSLRNTAPNVPSPWNCPHHLTWLLIEGGPGGKKVWRFAHALLSTVQSTINKWSVVRTEWAMCTCNGAMLHECFLTGEYLHCLKPGCNELSQNHCCRAAVPNLLTSADPHWITTGSRGPLSHFYDLKLKTIHKKYTNSTQQTNTQITKYFI